MQKTKRTFINMSHQNIDIFFDEDWLFQNAYDHPVFAWLEKQDLEILKKINAIYPGPENEINILWKLEAEENQEINLKNPENLKIKSYYPRLEDDFRDFPLPPELLPKDNVIDASNSEKPISIWSPSDRKELFTINKSEYAHWSVDPKDKIWKRDSEPKSVWPETKKPKKSIWHK
jgi:hypothetical protein